MAIDKLVFHHRYRLAQFIAADSVFRQVINQPNFATLDSLKALMPDGGFYLAAYRIVNNLTQIDLKSEEDAAIFKQRTIDSKTLFFLRSNLEQVAERNLTDELSKAKKTEELVKLGLFDALVLKGIYEQYFMAYEKPLVEAYEFLDDVAGAQARSSIPINAFNIFTLDELELIEGLFDFTSNVATRQVIELFKKHPQISTLAHFLLMCERFAIVPE